MGWLLFGLWCLACVCACVALYAACQAWRHFRRLDGSLARLAHLWGIEKKG
jgi:hypothetical protein